MSITHLTSSSQLASLVSSRPSSLIVIDFHATWCGPCHAIAPYYESLAKSYPSVTFTKCDVDACREVAQEYRGSAMPTFVFLKGGRKVDQVRGADKNGIAAALKKHSAGSSTAHQWGSGGQRLGDGTDPVPSPSSSSTVKPTTTTPAATAPRSVGSLSGASGAGSGWKVPRSVREVRGVWEGMSTNAKVGVALLGGYLILLYMMR